MADDAAGTAPILKSLEDAEWFAVFARGGLGFRYGPYTSVEVGQIMTQCVEEGIPVLFSAQGGREIDWELMRGFVRGVETEYHSMDSAPRDGRTIIAEVSGYETRVVWWQSFECWRELLEDGRTVGKPVHPTKWRERTVEDEQDGN